MADPNSLTERQVLGRAEEIIRRALPEDWTVKIDREVSRGRSRTDGLMKLTSPSGETVTFVVEAKRSSTTKTLESALDRIAGYLDAVDTNALPLIAVGYLGPSAQELLIQRGASYVDATGNLRLSSSRPGLFIQLTGATKDPWPDDQPLRSLRGRGAGRAVRALVDFPPPYGVRELASRAEVAPATLSRVIDLLERETVVARDARGGVVDLDWAGAIRRWSQDYELRKSNAVTRYLDPRGLPAVSEKLGRAKWRYAVTTSLAAQRFAPIAPTRAAVIYVEDVLDAAERMKLQPADAGANVLLVEPFDPVVFERTTKRDNLVTAAPTQVAADLLTGPGREPSEGEELLTWMKKNEDAWRS